MTRLPKTLLLLALALASSARADDVVSKGFMTGNLPEYHVADAAAPLVTERNLVEGERFWPYQTALTRKWESLLPGSLGVLIRLESKDVARIDFGRDGLHEIPVGATDLVARANAIRVGKAEKSAPNLLFAIGPRLLDSASLVARGFPFADALEKRFFLCIFADPWRREFGSLVSALAPLRNRPDVLLVLFPQSHRPDSQVAGQLRAMKWTVPFVYAHLSEPYTRTLLEQGTAFPALSLQTGEGRVLYEGRFGGGALAKLTAAMGAQAAGE